MPFAIKNYFSGPFLVALASFLWATDALVRYPAVGKTDPIIIVLFEHILVVFLLFPWVLRKYGKSLFSLSPTEWLAAIFSGVGGSALGTVFFTASFSYVNPSVAVLLQKLQPIIVVIVAFLILGERPAKKFYGWGVVALIAGLILSFPDLNFQFLSDGVNLHSKGIQYAFAAAFLWATSTVSGKILLKRTPPASATFWRFAFGSIPLLGLLFLGSTSFPMEVLNSSSSLLTLLYLSLVPGLFAMLIYYTGLARTSASTTTFIELVYPIGAVILNTVFLHTPLDSVQTIAGGVLILAVAMISF